MKFFDRWKKRSFEEKMDDLSQTVLTENNIKDPETGGAVCCGTIRADDRYHKGNLRRKNRSTEQSRLI